MERVESVDADAGARGLLMDDRCNGLYCVIEMRRSPRVSTLCFENHFAPGYAVERSECSLFEVLLV